MDQTTAETIINSIGNQVDRLIDKLTPTGQLLIHEFIKLNTLHAIMAIIILIIAVMLFDKCIKITKKNIEAEEPLVLAGGIAGIVILVIIILCNVDIFVDSLSNIVAPTIGLAEKLLE